MAFCGSKGKLDLVKTTLMKCAFEHAQGSFLDDRIISFFFHAWGRDLEKSFEGMYRSLLLQLLSCSPALRPKLPKHSPGSVQQHGWTIQCRRMFTG